MISEIRREALETRLRRRVKELTQLTADAEVKILLPPVRCSEPALYVQAQRDRIDAYQREITALSAELEDLTLKAPEQLGFCL